MQETAAESEKRSFFMKTLIRVITFFRLAMSYSTIFCKHEIQTLFTIKNYNLAALCIELLKIHRQKASVPSMF